jgi:hypothetical protein
MKAFKLTLLVMAAALMAFGWSTGALAFHDGGVAHCDGCHTMHNSADGGVVGPGGGDLTIGSDPTSTCLNCHNGSGSYHINSSDGSNFTGGGDFYWMTKTFTWSAHGSAHASDGDNHGHNVVSLDYGLTADTTLTQAPGGTYNALALGCTSCHDPHGKKNGAGAIQVSGSYGADPTTAETGNFRLLGDDGYDAGSSVSFTSEVPIATAPSLFGGGETDANHVDYGQNMSEWCANCHGAFSGAGKHPASNAAEMSSDDIWINYNTYIRTGDMTGSQGTAYLALVPFERGTADPTALLPATTAGPADGTANVMCLSCHRAHASAFENMTRWDMTTEFIADSHPMATDGGVTGNDVLNSYYGRDLVAQFGEFQRSLCNKCHAQD